MSTDVVVAETIAAPAIERLRASGHSVADCAGWSRDDLLVAVAGARALIVRSATAVDAELLDRAPRLEVVARAGVGLDNVDVAEATARGVLVVNAPESNVLSAAEHTMALILAMARNVPQAHRSLAEGRWERSRWEGFELAGKTLGILGLGRIGALVAQRARAFDMQVVAHDPFVSAGRARDLGVELLALGDLLATSDVVTVHLPRTRETTGLIGAEALASAKHGIRIVNVARGGIVDEGALLAALESGRVAGAALDVFVHEPPTGSPLVGHPNVVATPHLGASTAEAQDRAGSTVADMVCLALANEFVPFAVNAGTGEVHEALRPFIPLAERIGRVFASYVGAPPAELEVSVQGEIGAYSPEPIVASALVGAMSTWSDQRVSMVNAPRVASGLGVAVRAGAVTASAHHDFLNLVELRASGRSMAATLTGRRREARIVMIDGHTTDVPPSRWMLVVKNDDAPGAIGRVTTALGDAGVNIANMGVGTTEAPGTAMMVIATTTEVPHATVEVLRGLAGISDVQQVAG